MLEESDQIDPNEITEFFVHAQDASDSQPEPTDLNYQISTIKNALENRNHHSERDIEQFILDFPRIETVAEDGITLENQDAEQTLNNWATELSLMLKVPARRIRAAISTLHQGVGQGALVLLHQLHGKKNDSNIIYRTLHNSQMSSSMLYKEYDKFVIQYRLPFQAIAESDDHNQLELFDLNKPDLIVCTQIVIKFDNYFANQDHIDPDSITHTTCIETKNPNLTFQYGTNKKYHNRSDDGYVLVSRQIMDQIPNWIMVNTKDAAQDQASMALTL